jgi:hypothetical protein
LPEKPNLESPFRRLFNFTALRLLNKELSCYEAVVAEEVVLLDNVKKSQKGGAAMLFFKCFR